MEQIKNLWALLQEKMNEDPLIKKAVIFGGIALSAIVVMYAIKAFKSNDVDVAPAQTVVQVDQPVATVQPAQSTAQAPVAIAPAQTPPTAAQQIVTMAVKPLEALSSMTPGFETTYAYAVGNEIANQSLYAKISTVKKDTSSFQFLAAIEDEATRAQIIPGSVVLQATTVGYFVVEQQSSPLLNVIINGADNRVIRVYIDDQVLPVAQNKLDGWFQQGEGAVSLPIVQALSAGIHRIKIVSEYKYNKRDLTTAIRVSIKREQDPSPIDLQVYREAPVQSVTPVAAAQSAAVTQSSTPATSVAN